MLLISGEGDKRSFFASPLEIPLTLSANFGELRPGHFHSGVDFKTMGVKGKNSLEDMLMGDTVRRVVSRAEVPVLVVQSPIVK